MVDSVYHLGAKEESVMESWAMTKLAPSLRSGRALSGAQGHDDGGPGRRGSPANRESGTANRKQGPLSF